MIEVLFGLMGGALGMGMVWATFEKRPGLYESDPLTELSRRLAGTDGATWSASGEAAAPEMLAGS